MTKPTTLKQKGKVVKVWAIVWNNGEIFSLIQGMGIFDHKKWAQIMAEHYNLCDYNILPVTIIYHLPTKRVKKI